MLICNINKEDWFYKVITVKQPKNESDVCRYFHNATSMTFNNVDSVLAYMNNPKPLEEYLSKVGIKYTVPSGHHDIDKTAIDDSHWTDYKELFTGIPGGMNKFDNFLNAKVFEAALIGYGPTYPSNNFFLTDNLNELKNNLFKDVYDYADKNSLLSDDDRQNAQVSDMRLVSRSQGVAEGYDLYKSLIPKVENYILSKGHREGKDYIPNFKTTRGDDFKTLCNVSTLLNFDQLIKDKFKGILGVSVENFGEFSNVDKTIKYIYNLSGQKTETWLDDSKMDQDVSLTGSNLLKKLCSTIPLLTRGGQDHGMYMTAANLYTLGSAISHFQRTHMIDIINGKLGIGVFDTDPVRAINSYIDKAVFAYDNKWGIVDDFNYSVFRKDFKTSISTMRSLKAFFNKISVKEAKSDNYMTRVMTQAIQNAYDASYSQEFANSKAEVQGNSVEDYARMDLQFSIYNHLKNNISHKEIFKVTSIDDPSEYNIKNDIKNLFGINLNSDGVKAFLVNTPLDVVGTRLNTFRDGILGIGCASSSTLEEIKELEDSSTRVSTNDVKTVMRDFFKDGTVQDILDAKMDSNIALPRTVTESYEGNRLPTNILCSLIQNDISAFSQHSKQLSKVKRDLGNTRQHYNNFYLKYGFNFGTEIRLETINKEAKMVKDGAMLNAYENFFGHFKNGFLEPLFNKPTSKDEIKGFKFQPCNFSDKTRVTDKVVDMDHMFNIGTKEEPKIVSLRTITNDQLNTLLKNSYEDYYTDLCNIQFGKYKRLGIKITNNFGNNIKNINEFLSGYDGDYDGLLNKFRESGDEFTEELDYSSYKNGIRFNKDIENYYRVSHDDNMFKTFMEWHKTSMLQKLYSDNKSDKIEKLNLRPDSYPEYTKYFRESKDHFWSMPLYIDDKMNPLLEKYYLTHQLLQNEYIYATVKPEYMHGPKVEWQPFSGKLDNKEMTNWMVENDKRMTGFAKRAVGYTGTYVHPSPEYMKGVPEHVNIAAMEDVKDSLFNLSGDNDNIKIADGQTYIPYVFSKMIDESNPGQGYEGVKKELGILVTPFGSCLKKDGESIIDNAKILDSRMSPINMLSMQRKVFSIPLNDNLTIPFTNAHTGSLYFKDGEYYGIRNYKVDNGNMTVERDIYSNGEWQRATPYVAKINNLYDVWNAFGAQYSVDSDFHLNENSQDMLYDFVTKNNLKEKMIHYVSNHTTLKSGATNLNPSYCWTDDADANGPINLSYSTYDRKNIGVQLSATRSVEGETVREVTQVLSALAQNPETSEQTDQLYNILSDSINNELQKGVSSIRLSEDIIRALKNSRDNISQTLGSNISKEDISAAISNPNVFNEYMRMLISNLNNKYIARRYYGLGGILTASHMMARIYEDVDGNTWTQSDIAEEAIRNHDGSNMMTEDIINGYINNKLKPKVVKSGEIRIGDTCTVNENGEDHEYTLNSLEKYYDFKEKYGQNTQVTQILNRARDLKPIQISWDSNNMNYNLFDLPSVKLSYDWKLGRNKYSNALEAFKKHFNIQDDKELSTKLNIWTQRGLSMLSKGMFLNVDLDNFKPSDIFGLDDLTDANIQSRYDQYKNLSLPITNYKKRAAECMTGNVYSDIFGEASVGEITNKGSKYFSDLVDKIYGADNTNADFKINAAGRKIYVKYVPSNSQYKNSRLNAYTEDGKDILGRIYNGNELFRLPEGAKYVDNGDSDMIYITDIDQADKLYFSLGGIRSVVPLSSLGDYSPVTCRIFNRFTNRKVFNFVSFNKYKSDIAKKMYASWMKSREFVCSRIPAQSLQSAMEMKNIGYHRGKFNDVYVSAWQIFIQGSDFDGDKGWFMGHQINKSGFIDMPNDVFDYADINDLNIIESMRLPSGNHIAYDATSQVDLTDEYNIVKNLSLRNISEADSEELSAFKTALDKLGNSSTFTVEKAAEKDLRGFTSILDKYNSGRDYQNNNAAVSNGVVSKMKEIISSPTNQIYANQPVVTDDFEEGANDALAEKEANLDERSSALLESNNEGESNDEYKKRVKDGLEQIYGVTHLHMDTQDNMREEAQLLYKMKNSLDMHDIHSMYDQQERAMIGKMGIAIAVNGNKGKFSLNSYYNNFYNSDISKIKEEDLPLMNEVFVKKLFVNGKYYTICSIADTSVSDNMLLRLKNAYGLDETPVAFRKGNAAKMLSEFISVATNNAKLLVMPKINATAELSCMHIYMMALGFNAKDIAKFMNSPCMEYVLSHKDNIYASTQKDYASKYMTQYIDAHPKDEGAKSTLEIYRGGREINIFAQILGVNQKMKTDVTSLHDFFNKFSQAIYQREMDLFGSKNNIELMTTKCINNLHVENSEDNRKRVRTILNRADKLDILLNFDPNKLSDRTYFEATRDYYNCIKHSINIFDAIDKSPLFKAMTDAVYDTEEKAMLSGKYKFIFKTAQDVIDNYTPELSAHKGLGGRININEKIYKRLSNVYDENKIALWLKSMNISFNLSDVLKQAGLGTFIAYNSDKAKMSDAFRPTVTPDDNYVFDLSSDHGIATFKKMMEEIIYPMVRNTPFGEDLGLRSVRNRLGIWGNQIVCTNSLSSLNTESGIDKYEETVFNFDNIGKSNITYSNGKKADYRDLFWLYNLVTNNEGYGPNRLTALFENYLKDPSALAYDYYSFADEPNISDEQVLYSAFNNGGKYYEAGIRSTIDNPDFVINTTLTDSGRSQNFG